MLQCQSDVVQEPRILDKSNPSPLKEYIWVKVVNKQDFLQICTNWQQNKCDASNAAENEDIHQRYHLALADLRND